MPAAEVANRDAGGALARAAAEFFRANRSHAPEHARVAVCHPEVGEPIIEPPSERPKCARETAAELTCTEEGPFVKPE